MLLCSRSAAHCNIEHVSSSHLPKQSATPTHKGKETYQSRADLIGKGKQDPANGHQLQQRRGNAEARVGGLVLLDPLLALRLAPLLQLEVARVRRGAGTARLHDDEEDGADDGDEVEREVEEVADDGARGELRKGPLDDCYGWCGCG